MIAKGYQPHRLVFAAFEPGLLQAGVQIVVVDLAPNVKAVSEQYLGIELHSEFAVDI